MDNPAVNSFADGFLSTPSARRATQGCFLRFAQATFLSTPSARRATPSVLPASAGSGQFLSTPSARRATKDPMEQARMIRISIHALREEGDPASCRRPTPSTYFYPRPPRGGRLLAQSSVPKLATFLSTPSARRATWSKRRAGIWIPDFYPRPPRGGRRVPDEHEKAENVGFLSTPSARRATAWAR